MRIANWLVTLTLPAIAAIAPVRDVNSEAILIGRQPYPGFYEGYSFFVDEPSSHIRIYSPDGPSFLDTYVEEKTAPHVLTVAADSDGTVAVSFLVSEKNSAGIDLLDRTGTIIGSFSTANYLPSHIAFGNDHSIWTFGWERSRTTFSAMTEYTSVRQYSRTGDQLGAYMPRSRFVKGMTPACQSWQEQGIYIAADRIGLLACSGKDSTNPEWVELDFHGNLLGRWPLGMLHPRVAFTRDGHVYAQETVGASARKIYVLDRGSSSFQQVSWTVPGRLYGAAGNELVFGDSNNGPIRFQWYKQP
jgi:hypothetical protein